MKYQFDPFSVKYEQIISPVADFKSECILAANKALLQNKDNLPVVVMMSGGIDSQFVAESLLLAGIPFKCVIGRLLSNLVNDITIFNKHDYIYAERWCITNKIEIMYCDIDIFGKSKLLTEYALSANTFSPQYACHMYIMKWCNDNKFFFLAGNGEMDIVLHNNQYCMMDEQREFTLDNFCKLHNLSGIFQFWKQDSRLISAFLKLPTVELLMEQKTIRLLDQKHRCFSDVFVFENRTKRTGFECVQEWDAILRTHLKRYVIQNDDKFYTPITYFTAI